MKKVSCSNCDNYEEDSTVEIDTTKEELKKEGK